MNVTGLPVIPEPVTVAVSVLLLVPGVGPRVHDPTVAMPEAFVVAVPPVTLPPPVATANVTCTPATGLLPASLTITDGSTPTAVPTCARLTVSPAAPRRWPGRPPRS